MILSVESLFDSNKRIKIEEFTVKDMRTISFLIESNSDDELYQFLISKIITPCNSLDKLNVLLYIRINFIDEMISMTKGDKDMKINLNSWYKNIKNNFKNIRQTLEYNKFSVILNYPENIRVVDEDSLIVDCIESITLSNNEIILLGETTENKIKILERLPLDLIDKISNFIKSEILSSDILLMPKTSFLEELTVNILDGSAFELLKSLFQYYTPDNLVELIFSMSRRISDIEYMYSLSLREFNLLIRLYSEEVEKMTDNTPQM